jgi:hypothetical protein
MYHVGRVSCIPGTASCAGLPYFSLCLHSATQSPQKLVEKFADMGQLQPGHQDLLTFKFCKLTCMFSLRYAAAWRSPPAFPLVCQW